MNLLQAATSLGIFLMMYGLARVLLWAWRRLPPSPSRPKRLLTKSLLDTRDSRAAVHEAGHALLAWWSTSVDAVAVVTIEAKGTTEGQVTYQTHLDRRGAALSCELVICLAGIAGELATFGSATSVGGRNDLRHARALVRALLREHYDARWNVPAAIYPPPPFGKLYVPPLSTAEEEFLLNAYAYARTLLAEGYVAHAKLVAALLAARTLDESHLVHILGTRAVVHALLRPFRATFVVPRTR